MKIALLLVLLLASATAMDGEALAAPVDPVGVTWHLLVLRGTPVPARPNERPPVLLLDADSKKVSGFTGCNSFFGNYDLSAATLRFGQFAMTRKACANMDPTLESRFLDALARTRGWKIEGDELLLVDNGDVLARFAEKQGVEPTAGLESLVFRSRVLTSGPVTLSAGEYRGPAAPGSASAVTARLTDKRAFGMSSGRSVGAVIVATATGGSGTFYELALLTSGPVGWVNSDTVLLGDRVKVDSLAIENGMVVVVMTVHGPKDPMCCPTLRARKRFAIDDDRLVPVAEDAATAQPMITGMLWQWVQTRYNDDKLVVPPKPESYTIRFQEDGTINVRADCNRKGGAYSTAGKTLSIRITHSTMAACEPGSLEDQFVRDLSAGAVYFFREGDLYIDLKYDTGTMKFSGKRE